MGTRSAGGGEVRVTLGARDGQALISVTDPGIGIPADQRDEVFHRFSRARNVPARQYAGLGIGLYIATSLPRSTFVRVRSTPGWHAH